MPDPTSPMMHTKAPYEIVILIFFRIRKSFSGLYVLSEWDELRDCG